MTTYLIHDEDGEAVSIGTVLADPMPEHLNLKNVFSAAQGRRKRYGMAKALHLCGLDLVGAHHRALDDAKNIARLLPWIVGGERLAGP